MSRAEMDALLARVVDGARAVERARVVVWLRAAHATSTAWAGEPLLLALADAIERCEHCVEAGPVATGPQ